MAAPGKTLGTAIKTLTLILSEMGGCRRKRHDQGKNYNRITPAPMRRIVCV